MSISASAVKGLSPLVLFLRYYLDPHELIVLDEPEMNLHPRAQAQIIELLAMLANSGIHVIITTHSPYIVDHLMNLMKAAKLKNKNRNAKKFYLQSKDAFIKQENVAVYLFQDNVATPILDPEGFIKWQTFSQVSSEIGEIYFDIT